VPTLPAFGRPLLLAVDADPAQLGRIETELQHSFGGDYRVGGETTVADAGRVLRDAHDRDDVVALVLVDRGFLDEARSDLFELVRRLHPDARRALLVDWGDWVDRGAAQAVLHAMAVEHVGYYVLTPWIQGDELFHRTVAELVQEWSRSAAWPMREVVVVAAPGSARAYAISDLLTRNGIPHAFRDRASEFGREVLERTGSDRARVAVWMPALAGRTLVDPTDAELVEAWGVPTTLAEDQRTFDALVVGGGPAGLAAAVHASSEGLRTLVVEQESVGGQAGSSSLIRNYLGFLRGISGAELAQHGYQQAWVFGAHFVLTHEVDRVCRQDGEFVAHVGGIGTVRASGVIVATGVSDRRPGAEPRTDWLPEDVGRDRHGFLLTGADAAASGWSSERQPHPHETTVPGLFAVGDVRCGSVKRVACAVGEGSAVVSQLQQYLATLTRG
jgi:thioredoxin reductase (NADPH)